MDSLTGADGHDETVRRKGPKSLRDAAPSGRWRRAAALGIGAEALGLGVYGGAYGIHALSLPEPAFAIGLAAFYLLVAAGLLLVARAFDRGARWSVSAALTWQALLTLAGINLTGVRPAYGIVLAVAGAGIGIAVLVGGRDALRPSVDG
ncbi:hypothetical protein [Demequina gelatinilytica]|uniref:hypothetical protein n=1 Tax=Demequina gelatinilytica TaxID=1638980 RepID=UPI0007811E0F|nr:hypothetical protein [Demequina gelatinilytica]